jgi:hypothetical protein
LGLPHGNEQSLQCDLSGPSELPPSTGRPPAIGLVPMLIETFEVAAG